MSNTERDALAALSAAATQGTWEIVKDQHTCYIDPSLQDECEHADSPIVERAEWVAGVDGARESAVYHVHESYDAHYITPGVAGNYDYESGGIIQTADAEFIVALVNAYRAGDLVDREQVVVDDATRDQAERAAHKILHHLALRPGWAEDDTAIRGQAAHIVDRVIAALTPDGQEARGDVSR
jgi:hypothetical protein